MRNRTKLPFGSALEHGKAHLCDHFSRSRRSFLGRAGLAAAGAPFLLGSTRVQGFAAREGLSVNANADRVLVIVRMDGGNDGFNTVIPITNDIYYNNRPVLAIPGADSIRISDDYGLHPNLARIAPMYQDGRMAVVHGVGYPEANLSHFESMDFWDSGSEPASHQETGWLARQLESEYPDFRVNPTKEPLAIELGSAISRAFVGPSTHMAMALRDPDEFERIATTGFRYDVTDVEATARGTELSYLRTVANASDLYAGVIKNASDRGANSVDFYQDTYGHFPESLSIVSRLIKGGLSTPVYIVTLVGFDTHYNQAERHGGLMTELAEGLRDFFDDLEASDDAKRVTVMTYSEFGRRLEENGSEGTDHGTAAPMLFFGDNVVPGFHGAVEDLTQLDKFGNPDYRVDYRSVYATVLQEWLGVTASETDAALMGAYPRLGLFNSQPVGIEIPEVPDGVRVSAPAPNPFQNRTILELRLPVAAQVQVEVFNMRGQLVRALKENHPAGPSRIELNLAGESPGVYMWRLRSGGSRQTGSIVKVAG